MPEDEGGEEGRSNFPLAWLQGTPFSDYTIPGLVTQQTWWLTVTIMAAAISIVAIVPWINAWPTTSMIGALLVDVAVLVALLPPRGQQLVHSL